MDNVYFIFEDSLDTCGCYIVSRDTGLRIKVFSIETCPFSPDNDEIQMYAFHRGKLLAFETKGIQPDDAIDVIDAIHWYARYVKNAGMEIMSYNPRDGKSSMVI